MTRLGVNSAAFLTVIFCFIAASYATVSGDNILEVGKCVLSKFRGSIESERTLYSGSSSIIETLETRSLMDCVDQCMGLRRCYGALYTETGRHDSHNYRGKCVLLDRSYETQEAADLQGYELIGKFVSLSIYELDGLPTGGDSCDSISCATGASCYTLCDQSGDHTPYPYCIADNTDCDQDEEFTNIRYYFGDRYGDGTDDGIVQHITYDKQREDTWIRIIWHTSFRGHGHATGVCHQWYVTFDGSDCSDPTKIVRVDYSATTGIMIRGEGLDGTCKNIAKGSRRLDFRIGPCPGYGSDGYTAWRQVRQLIVMEIVPRTQAASKPCPGLSVFNYQYKADLSYTSQHGYGATIFSDTYKKAASDTNIRVKFQATMRVEQVDSQATCGRWSIYVDGSECSPQGDVVIYHSTQGNPSYHRYELKGYTLEAVCQNLGIGNHTIDIRTLTCYYAQSYTANFHTGWNSGMRLHIEEVRQVQRLDAVLTSDKRVLRSPISNVYHQHHWLWNHGGDNQELTYFTYTKNNDWTGMRFTASGDHRSIFYSGTNCARWWFQIDNSECSNPGPVEGVYYFNYETDFHHPMQVSGVCLGSTSGLYRISYHIGICTGYSSYGDGFTGWGSSFHIIVEEIAFEETKTCANGSPMNCDN